jgi:putative hydrolase of the HAD superfamily
MSKRHVRALILDYGGVLSLPQDADSVQHMAETLNQAHDDFCQVYRAQRAPYDSGLVSGEEYWRGVLEHCGIKADGFDISRLIRHDIQSWTQLNESMLQFVTDHRDSIHQLVILSNMTRETLAFMRRNFCWLELFDVQTYSCEEGCSKPSRRIYEHCLDRLSVPAGDCLFVDDSTENVRGALKVGIPAIQFGNTAQFLSELDQFCLTPSSSRRHETGVSCQVTGRKGRQS